MQLTGSGTVITLTSSTAGVLLGRRTPAGVGSAGVGSPALDMLARDGSLTSVPLSYPPGYAAEAVWSGVDIHNGQILALGGARGGAHGNVRWTVWRGTLSGVSEEPQAFETFGGWLAGTMVGVAQPEGGMPLLVGTWSDARRRGFDITLWHPDGSRWVRAEPTATALAGSPTDLPSPEQVATAGSSVVIAGWSTDLSAGVRTIPVVWVMDADGTWRREELTAPDVQTMALGVGCGADRCLVVGQSRTSLLAWWLRPAHPFSLTGTPAIRLPGVPREQVGPAPAPVIVGDTAYVLAPERDHEGRRRSRVVSVATGRAATVTVLDGDPIALVRGSDHQLLAATSISETVTVLSQGPPLDPST